MIPRPSTTTSPSPNYHDVIVERRTHMVIYVDGSYMIVNKIPRAGAGVVFLDNESCNAWIPVPLSASLPYDSMRAELYAAVCALYLIQMKYYRYSPHTLYQIKQDCVGAIFLLRWAYALDKAPSRFLIERKSSDLKSSLIPVPWAKPFTVEDVLGYEDVLDEWWFWTRGCRINLIWVPAHQANSADLAIKVANVDYSYNPANAEADWKGNQKADIWAKSACTSEALARLTEFADFPLYPLFNDDSSSSISISTNKSNKSQWLPLGLSCLDSTVTKDTKTEKKEAEGPKFRKEDEPKKPKEIKDKTQHISIPEPFSTRRFYHPNNPQSSSMHLPLLIH